MAIKFMEYCQFVCMDDKHKYKVGEPGLPVTAVERGKREVVCTNSKLFSVADHDFSMCDTYVPETIDGSFYRG